MKKIISLAVIITALSFASSAKTYPMPGQWIKTSIAETNPSGTVTIEITCSDDASKTCYVITTPGPGLGFPVNNFDVPNYQGEMMGTNLQFNINDAAGTVFEHSNLQSINAFANPQEGPNAQTAQFHFQGVAPANP